MTTLFVEPRDIEVPITDELFYWNAARELGYSPLVIKIGSTPHTSIKSSDEVPGGHIYVPERITESVSTQRFPDQRPILIAKESGANMIYDMVEQKMEEKHGKS